MKKPYLKSICGLHFIAIILIFLTSTGALNGHPSEGISKEIVGIVFHDKEKSGTFNPSVDVPLEGIAVSNGRNIVLTDHEGRYRLELLENSFIFVIKPRNWNSTVDNLQIPRFYHKYFPQGATGAKYTGLAATTPLPESADFPMYPVKEPDEFEVIVFADTQPRNERELHYLTRDAVDELIGYEAAFGVTLGDLVFDDLDLFKPLNQIISKIGVPWRHIIGNHDIDFTADNNIAARGSYFRHYGPSYYSFEYGPAHFIVMDNIRFIIDGDNRYYRPEVSENHMIYLENELARLDKDKLLIILLHIPWDDRGWNIEQRNRLAELLSSHTNVLSLGAHWHRHYHRFLDEDFGFSSQNPHHMVSVGAVCGAWWRGFTDEYGIPHAVMSDGTPAGYGILKISDNQAKLHWQSSRRSADFQMHIHVKEKVDGENTHGMVISANIFNAMPDAEVKMRIGDNGQWIPMQRIIAQDPLRAEMLENENTIREQFEDFPGLEMRGAANSYKLWQAEITEKPEPGMHVIHIKSKDRWWEHEGKKVLWVKP